MMDERRVGYMDGLEDGRAEGMEKGFKDTIIALKDRFAGVGLCVSAVEEIHMGTIRIGDVGILQEQEAVKRSVAPCQSNIPLPRSANSL